MSIQTIDRRLGRTRVAFSELVQLRSGRERELWTHATDLSERGLHVRADTVLSPGTAMELELPLPHVSRSLSLRGRVAWSRQERDPGMGIEFVDLSDHDLSFLRREVMEGRPREWRREVKVWFEGTREPTRALAFGAGASLRLVSDLGFLKQGSQVVVYGEPGAEPLVGRLAEVSLRRAGAVPELVIAVDPQGAERDAPDETWTHWPPPPVRAIAAETDAIIIEESVDPSREVHPLETGSSIAGTIDARERPEPVLNTEPKVATGSEGWELGAVAPSETSDWKLAGPSLTLQLPRLRRRRRGRWLWWLAAALMVGITVASMSYTKSWLRVRDRLQALLGEIGQRRAPRAAEFPLQRPASLAPDAAPRVVPAAAPALEPAPATQPARPSVDEATRRLSIPLQGSLRGSQSYPLAAPAGLAINLPHARPVAGYGDFEVQRAGFRSVWVRRRGEGMHVRIFFAPERRASFRLERETLVVELSEGSR